MLLSGIKKSTLLDYPGKIATIVFTMGCNMRCGYCHNSEFVLPEKIQEICHDCISEDVFFRFLKTRTGFLDGVVICGGEPTIHNDLPDFCRKIKEAGFLVKLDTNGSNPAMLEHLIDENLLDYVAMDIKYPLEQYRLVSGVEIDTRLFRRSIELIKTHLPDYEFRTTVIKGIHSGEDIRKIGETIQGAKNYYLQNYRPGNTLDPNFQGMNWTEIELIELQKTMEPYVGKCGVRM